jgi:hypothetical protein
VTQEKTYNITQKLDIIAKHHNKIATIMKILLSNSKVV